MLSYRHSFHAGNFADVLKHIVLVEIIQHLLKKDKPFDYIDTHAGAGLYQLNSEQASKTGEYLRGIAQLNPSHWPELSQYFEVIKSFNRANELNCYPGSPLIALELMRKQDKAWLFELHPADFELLKLNTKKFSGVKTRQSDGFKGLLSVLPPTSRRGVVLIDPSYEIKTDYEQVINYLHKALQKFASGIYALWYPVVDRYRIDKMQRALLRMGIRDIQRFELGIAEDSSNVGMTSAGMIVINPPWLMFDKMALLLPKLAKILSGTDNVFYKCDILSTE
ncbi:MAG TPA: 23S rRNA (adenine(2030)-N(6))-methyltransferase RlmJ [Aeromonadales bacterium]|nr:23S rRNA (adenine(2030)-N(6))-methyltransferase RlmJ [Aeromonadales bacterium]